MDCGGCERKVETALKRLRSIEHVSASALAGSVQLTVCSGEVLPYGEVASTIKVLGYQMIDESAAATASKKTPPWWQSPKGRLVIVSGALRALVWGITGMWVAVMADTGATVLVTHNALYLLRYRFNDV